MEQLANNLENRDAYIIIGAGVNMKAEDTHIVMADSLLGEITPAMANAISASKAYKILIPTNRCNHFIAGCQTVSLSESIRAVCEEVGRVLKEA